MRSILILSTLTVLFSACTKSEERQPDPSTSKATNAETTNPDAKDTAAKNTNATNKPEGAPAPDAGSTAGAPQEKASAPKLDETIYDHFGAGVTEGPSIAVADLLADPTTHLGKTVTVTGPITSVCQTKGCWMYIGPASKQAIVRFKDYGFFVPKDASGRMAAVEGVFSQKQMTVEETKHLLVDAGKNEEAEKVTEGKKTYHFLATGVAIKKPVQ